MQVFKLKTREHSVGYISLLQCCLQTAGALTLTFQTLITCSVVHNIVVPNIRGKRVLTFLFSESFFFVFRFSFVQSIKVFHMYKATTTSRNVRDSS